MVWTLQKDLELADLVTWGLKCPVLQSDPEQPGLCGRHSWTICLKAEGDMTKELPQASAQGDLEQPDLSLPFQAGAPPQKGRAGPPQLGPLLPKCVQSDL